MRATKLLVAAACVALAASLLFHLQTVTAGPSQPGSDLAAVRAATAQYHNLSAAHAGGYGLFPDAAGIACIDNPPVGGMGVHYVNLALVKSGKIDALKPQALVYAPGSDGQLQLAAVEYIAFQGAWDSTHTMAPMLFGQMFMLTPAGNRFGIPAYYSLHVWVWRHNPSGMFKMWNPNVSCGA